MKIMFTHCSRHLFLQALVFVLLTCFYANHLQGQTGNALHFDGMNDFVELGNSSFYSGKFTIEGWIKPQLNTKDKAGAIFTAQFDGRYTAIYAEVMSNGKIRFMVRNPPGNSGGAVVLGTEDVVGDGEWHHFAAVKGDGNKLYLYIDGQLDGTSNIHIGDFDTTLGHNLVLGMNWTGATRYYKGQMDEIRFWNRARTEAEIQRDRDITLTGNEAGLVAYYNFNQGVANGDNSSIHTLNDSKGTLNGTLKNFEMNGSASNFIGNYSMVNVALGKPARQSSTKSDRKAELGVDGRKMGRYNSGVVTRTTDELEPWWEVDLGEIYDISEVNIWNRRDVCCWTQLKDFYVLVSETPITTNSTSASQGQFVDGPFSFSSDETNKTITINQKGRYVRVFKTSTTPVGILLSEVEVFEKQAQNTQNIAANPDPISEGIWFVIQNKSNVKDDLNTPAQRMALKTNLQGTLTMQQIPLTGNFDEFLWRTKKYSEGYRLINKLTGKEQVLDLSNDVLSLKNSIANSAQQFFLEPSNTALHGTNAYTISNASESKVLQYNNTDNTIVPATKQVNELKQVWLFQPMELAAGYSIPKTAASVFNRSLELSHGYQLVATESVSDWAILNAHLVIKNMLNALAGQPLQTMKGDARNEKTVVIFSPADALTINEKTPYLFPEFGQNSIDDTRGGSGTNFGIDLMSEELMNSTVGSDYREFDQIIHEFAHHIDHYAGLNAPAASPTNSDKEWFPWEVQFWFNNAFSEPGWTSTKRNNRGTMTGAGKTYLNTIFKTGNTWLPPRLLRDRDGVPAPPVTNNALDFDGVNDFVELGNNSFYSGKFTIEGWIKPQLNTKDRAGAIFNAQFDGRNTAIYAEVMSNGKIRFMVRNPPGNSGGALVMSTEDVVGDGKWHHFAAVKGDGNKLYLYIDGQLDGTSSIPIGDFDTTVGHNLVLGINWTGATRYYKGQMDEIRFWNRARTEAEIQRDKDKTLTGAEAGLVVYYNFNQGVVDSNNGDITTLNDSKGALNGTLKNFQLIGSTSNFSAGAPVAD